MSSPIAAPTRFAGATILTAALVLCTTASAQAQEQAASDERAPQVSIVTEGVYASPHPVARVHIDRPGYVALFEVEPGVGATMLYPDDPADPERFDAGVHELRLNGVPAANRRLLMRWHLGWAFAQRPFLVPRNHLVAVVSRQPLDASKLLSQRILHYSKNRADADEVTLALLSTVTEGMGDHAWSAARTSYDKHRDPRLLATFDPWVDAPFYPLARELAFTGYPPEGQAGFRFACGAAFAATGEAFTARTAHDLNVCRHAEPDRRMLADLGWEEGLPPDREAARADGRASPDVEENAPGRSSLPEEVRETLRRVADAADRTPTDRHVEALRRLESAGRAMMARGIEVDGARLRTLRARAEAMARRDDRIRRMDREAGIDRPALDRPLGPGSAPEARRGSPSIQGSGSGSAAGRSDPDAGRPSPREIRDRARPAEGGDRPDGDRPRSSGDG